MEVILDKSQEQARGTEADLISENGIPTYIDSAYRIAHDKVMVITGSFNFTKSAENYNAENLLVISNDPPLANINTQRVGRSILLNRTRSIPAKVTTSTVRIHDTTAPWVRAPWGSVSSVTEVYLSIPPVRTPRPDSAAFPYIFL